MTSRHPVGQIDLSGHGSARRDTVDDKRFEFPSFSCSDKSLKETWDYRCRLFNMHIKETAEGYIVTEFLPDVPWAGKYNAISCPAMFHILDGRWLTDKKVISDYIDFWCNNPRDAMNYSFPLCFSTFEYYKVTGDRSILKRNYSKLCENVALWEKNNLTDNGMFTQLCDRDGMEYSVSGNGIRTTVNSYMYGEYDALDKISRLLKIASDYGEKAEKLKFLIQKNLWNEKLGFFTTLHEDGSKADVRELTGYVPYAFGVTADHTEVFDELWKKDGFYGKYGPTTAERRHPEFNKYFDHECLWNGPSWPFATSQTLQGFISLLDKGVCDEYVDPDKFLDLLNIYSSSQRDTDMKPYIDENLDADTGEWIARRILCSQDRSDKDRGRDYNHSSFIDITVRGVCGIVLTEKGFRVRKHLSDKTDFELGGIKIRSRDVAVIKNGRKVSVYVDGKLRDPDEEIVL